MYVPFSVYEARMFTIVRYDDVLTMVVTYCADSLELGRYLLPSKKHCLLRVMPYLFFFFSPSFSFLPFHYLSTHIAIDLLQPMLYF